MATEIRRIPKRSRGPGFIHKTSFREQTNRTHDGRGLIQPMGMSATVAIHLAAMRSSFVKRHFDKVVEKVDEQQFNSSLDLNAFVPGPFDI